MAENKGMIYEKVINDILRKNKLQSTGFRPAGADSNAPDAELLYNKVKYKVEVKLDTKVDFGQGSLHYDVKTNKWSLGGAKTESAQQMRDFLEDLKIPELVNKEWGSKGAPRKFAIEDMKFFTKEDVDYDYKTFKDAFVDIPSTAVSNYYNSKKTYYIQIGKYGLYCMGKDPAGLGVPEIKFKLRLRIRIKRGGSFPIYNYRFTTAIQMVTGSLTKSKYSLDDLDYIKVLVVRGGK